MVFILNVVKICQMVQKLLHNQHTNIFTFRGKEWAENIIMTSFLTSSGNSISSVLILSATVFANNGCVAHRSIMLHLTPTGNFLKLKKI